jgi:tetratricopeptide (TPR) repeat protein
MKPVLPKLALAAVLIGAAIGPFVTCTDRQVPPVTESAPATEEDAARPTGPSRGTDMTLSRLDDEIAFYTDRGETGRSWLNYELAALRYLERQRLTGDYADFRGAEHALNRAFEFAPAGSGPFFTRMTLNFTLHRLAPLEADVVANEHAVLLAPDRRLAMLAYRAEIAFYRGEYDVALQRYEGLVAEDRDAISLVALAQYHWRTGDLARADELFTEAEAEGDDAQRAWLCLVRALFEVSQDHWDAAGAAIDRGLTHRPGWWQLEEHQGQVLFEQGALEDARAVFEGAYAHAPSPEILDALAVLALEQGRRSDAADLSERAEAMHEERIAMFPEAAAGHALDHFLLLSDDLDRAIELAELNRDARPFGEAQAKLAIAYARAGRWDDALEVIYVIEGGAWSTAESEAIAALVHQQVGDPARARAHRDRANTLAASALDRVQAILRGR